MAGNVFRTELTVTKGCYLSQLYKTNCDRFPVPTTKPICTAPQTVHLLTPCSAVPCELLKPFNCFSNQIQGSVNNIDKEIACVSVKNVKLKCVKIWNFSKFGKLRCRGICEPQNREINLSRKFHNCNKVVLMRVGL